MKEDRNFRVSSSFIIYDLFIYDKIRMLLYIHIHDDSDCITLIQCSRKIYRSYVFLKRKFLISFETVRQFYKI